MFETDQEEQFSHLQAPVEYKDAPLRFTFFLNGREEPVRIVERDLDLPFPEGGRLVVEEAATRICDVTFRFLGGAEKPYQLTFGPADADGIAPARNRFFGATIDGRQDMRAVHRQLLLQRGHVSAAIEMSRGKARLRIRYARDQASSDPGPCAG